jgi:uncharacterized protein
LEGKFYKQLSLLFEMDKVVHFEIPFDDKEKCKDFYEKVFGWQMQDMPGMDYTIARSGEVDENQMMKEKGVINGGMFKRVEDLKVPMITLNVKSVDATLEKVKGAGGEVVREKSAVGEMGFIAYLKDSEGNVVGLWEDMKKE